MIELIEILWGVLLNITVNLPSSAHMIPTRMRGGNSNSSNSDEMWLILVLIALVIILFYYLAARNEIKPFQFHKNKHKNTTKK